MNDKNSACVMVFEELVKLKQSNIYSSEVGLLLLPWWFELILLPQLFTSLDAKVEAEHPTAAADQTEAAHNRGNTNGPQSVWSGFPVAVGVVLWVVESIAIGGIIASPLRTQKRNIVIVHIVVAWAIVVSGQIGSTLALFVQIPIVVRVWYGVGKCNSYH